MDQGERWFYAHGGERIGPVSESELLRLLARETIPADTLVWAPGLDAWSPADQVLDFVIGLPEAPVAPPPPPVPSVAAGPLHDPEAAPQIRPWVRYWARMLDLSLYAALVDWLVSPFGRPFDPENPDYLFTTATLLLVVLLEVLVVRVAGTTPGKALLRVRLRRADGGRLSMADSLQRALRLFVVGEGMFLLFVSVACMAFSYQRLVNRGTTWWDQAGRLAVQHGHVGPARALVAAAVIAGLGWLNIDWSQFS